MGFTLHVMFYDLTDVFGSQEENSTNGCERLVFTPAAHAGQVGQSGDGMAANKFGGSAGNKLIKKKMAAGTRISNPGTY